MLEEILEETIDEVTKGNKSRRRNMLSNEQIKEFQRKFREIYLSRESKIKIGIITEKIQPPFGTDETQKENIEFQYKIIKKLYTQIWIPSRQVERQNKEPK
ncbi:16150_t:CDS:1, partial [Gigaspora rosea]